MIGKITCARATTSTRVCGQFALAAAAAIASAQALGQTVPTPTTVQISISGSTAMRGFTTSAGFSALNGGSTGGSITLNTGVSGAPQTYNVDSGFASGLQLAQKDFTQSEINSTSNGRYKSLEIYWHEQGSVEGIDELANDQIGALQSVANSNRNPTTGNPIWINENSFAGTGTLLGHTISTSTYSPSSYQIGTGVNLDGGQNRVQMAISDVTSTQGFSKGGNTAVNGGAYMLTPTAVGYGKGNPKLPLATGGNINGVGVTARQSLNDENVLNMVVGATDPVSGATYTAGTWNSAGVGNTTNKTVAITATMFVANPGTGLEKLNRTDADFLQAAGRLPNGADFNMTTRDVNSGTRNVAALNTGMDVSFAVGENDAGNGNLVDGATNQVNIGTGIKFSNKTAGGGELRPTVQNSRMAVGTLSMSDAIGSTNNTASRPIRALDYRDDADDSSNGSNNSLGAGTFADPASGTFVHASAQSIVNGSYVIYQNETYVTLKIPDAVKYNQDLIKGDNAGNDVRDLRDNILNAVATFPSNSTVNPADSLVQNSFILPQFMQVRKGTDGLNNSTSNDPSAGGNYDSSLSGFFLGDPTLTGKFTPAIAAAVTTGALSTYGNVTPPGGQGAITITNTNYLFGNFLQNGIRDFKAIKAGITAQAALAASGLGTDMFSGPANSNNSAAFGSFTKGDLIVLGDMNSDGVFNGKDLYLMAHGAALADSAGTDTLSLSGGTLGDALRRGVLVKNGALDYFATATTATQKMEASANTTNDPTGANAFNKRDVNRDGLIDLNDAFIVDKFTVGGENTDHFNRITSLADQINATINVNGTINPDNSSVATGQISISLVDAELTDDTIINNSDVATVNQGLASYGKESWPASLIKNGVGDIVVAHKATDTGGATTISVASGAVLTINAGSFTAGGSADVFTDTANGRHLAIANNAGLSIATGTKNIAALSGTGSTTVSSGATLVADSIRQGTLTVAGNAIVRANGGATGQSTLTSLSITGSGKLDLNDNDLTITYSGGTPVSAIRGYLASGFNQGNWDGSGIASTAAHNNAAYTTALGYKDTGSQVIIKYTYYGDSNLDGAVNSADFQMFLDGFIAGSAGTWASGDYTYDGKVDLGNDFNLFLVAYLQQGGALGELAPVVLGESGLSLSQRSQLLALVPEPTAITLLPIAMTFVARRRKRLKQNQPMEMQTDPEASALPGPFHFNWLARFRL